VSPSAHMDKFADVPAGPILNDGVVVRPLRLFSPSLDIEPWSGQRAGSGGHGYGRLASEFFPDER
jgi:hypothetical protein